MARVKRAVHGAKAKRTTMELAKGYRGSRGRHYRAANEQVMHALRYAYRDRRARKGDFRALWIARINAAARAEGMTYNRFISGLRQPGRQRPPGPERRRRVGQGLTGGPGRPRWT